MPRLSLATYARWWQLETWLRELAYVELRAKYGVAWERVASASLGRQNADAKFAHMESADSKNPLAYLDYSQLVDIISDQWELFGPPWLSARRGTAGRQT